MQPEPFSLDNIVGTYAIHCRAVSSTWECGYTYDMTLSFNEPDEDDCISVAFDHGFVDGTMRITPSENELEVCCKPEANDEQMQGQATPYTSPPPSAKRTRNHAANAPPSKRVKMAVSIHAHRVHLRWCGHTNGADSARFNDDRGHTGWLDFPRADGGAFWGVVDMPNSIGNGIWFHGVRTARKPANQPLQ
jgi:hypothetical protein